MKRVAVLALALIAASCAVRTEVTEIPAEDLPKNIYSDVRQQDAPDVEQRVVIYFVREVTKEVFFLEPVNRRAATPLSPAEFAMDRLLKAELETPEEQRLKLGTAIPNDTKLLGIEVEDGVADVNLSSAFETPEDQVTHLLRIAQVVWTLTELPDIDAVRFSIHGVRQPVIAQDGRAHLEVGRGRYSDFAPRRSGPVTANEN